MRGTKLLEEILPAIRDVIDKGAGGYIFFMIFVFLTILLAQLILSRTKNRKIKIKGPLLFCALGLLIGILFILFSLEIVNGFYTFWFLLTINTLLFIIIRCIKKLLINKSKVS